MKIVGPDTLKCSSIKIYYSSHHNKSLCHQVLPTPPHPCTVTLDNAGPSLNRVAFGRPKQERNQSGRVGVNMTGATTVRSIASLPSYTPSVSRRTPSRVDLFGS